MTTRRVYAWAIPVITANVAAVAGKAPWSSAARAGVEPVAIVGAVIGFPSP